MKLSRITPEDVAAYLRLESSEYDTEQLSIILDTAKSYIESYTGIPATSDADGAETLDDHDDLWLACMVLCQDMYDNRSMYPDAKYAANANKVVESILGLHRRNLL